MSLLDIVLIPRIDEQGEYVRNDDVEQTNRNSFDENDTILDPSTNKREMIRGWMAMQEGKRNSLRTSDSTAMSYSSDRSILREKSSILSGGPSLFRSLSLARGDDKSVFDPSIGEITGRRKKRITRDILCGSATDDGCLTLLQLLRDEGIATRGYAAYLLVQVLETGRSDQTSNEKNNNGTSSNNPNNNTSSSSSTNSLRKRSRT